MYPWINFPSKIYYTCLFKDWFFGEKAAPRPFKSIPISAVGFLMFLFLFYLSYETPACHLSAYSTLHSETLTHILPCGSGELCHVFHDNYYSIDRYFRLRRLRLLSSSCFPLVLASISLNFNSDLFSSMNFSHGLSN